MNSLATTQGGGDTATVISLPGTPMTAARSPVLAPRLALGLITGAALVLGACHPAPLGRGKNRQDRAVTANARLDCPATEGALTRQEVSPDGRSCRYTGEDGAEARLTLMSLDGRSAQDALRGTEAEMQGLVPAAVAPEPAASSTPPTSHGATAQADADGDGDNDHSRIDLPGIHIEANGHDNAHIRAFGQVIDAHGKDATIHAGWNGKTATVNAHDGGAEIRAGWFGQRSVDASYILASDTAGPSGVHAAGYVAKGPAAGPLVLGVETSRTQRERGNRDDHRYRDIRRLVDRNVHNG